MQVGTSFKMTSGVTEYQEIITPTHISENIRRWGGGVHAREWGFVIRDIHMRWSVMGKMCMPQRSSRKPRVPFSCQEIQSTWSRIEFSNPQFIVNWSRIHINTPASIEKLLVLIKKFDSKNCLVIQVWTLCLRVKTIKFCKYCIKCLTYWNIQLLHLFSNAQESANLVFKSYFDISLWFKLSLCSPF